jgi:hypothetical protein
MTPGAFPLIAAIGDAARKVPDFVQYCVLAKYRRTATVGRTFAAPFQRMRVVLHACAPTGRFALLPQGKDMTAPLLRPLVADVSKNPPIVEPELAPVDSAREVPPFKVPSSTVEYYAALRSRSQQCTARNRRLGSRCTQLRHAARSWSRRPLAPRTTTHFMRLCF